VDTGVRQNRIALAWLVLSLCLFACDITGGAVSPGSETAVATVSSDWYTVYFADPTSPNAHTYRGGMDEDLAAAIDQARVSVDVAVYDFNLWSLRDALIAAQRRGVQVRMVTESDNMDEPEIQELKDAGIEVLGDRREGLMHDKFAVIDRQEVWTGSTNFTVGSVYQNDNNLIRIRSSRLADDYTTEFEEMFVDDQFGPGSPANTPYPKLTVDGTSLEVYFSPDDGALTHLVGLVDNARESVYFLAYSFTSNELAQAMIARAKDGVSVAGVFEESQYRSNTGTEYDNLRTVGLDVRLDGNPHDMHHKVIIIDEQIVITGSYNFSASAEERNDENVLIIFNPQIAAQYLQEFKRVYNLAQR
jgi:phosphatidylserine/phosphatidylglycerophosphate/cardiolipin synthase-like enzyme